MESAIKDGKAGDIWTVKQLAEYETSGPSNSCFPAVIKPGKQTLAKLSDNS